MNFSKTSRKTLIFTLIRFVTKFKSRPIRFKISNGCNEFRPFSDNFWQIKYIDNYKMSLWVVN